ncbi:hypothetical protein LXA47_29395 [Massilia sp. P8910]|uniref:Uncharacterized protein n=1 Tax=Massilia antarctica TaxID=2765360 RepID=A0AA48WI09_9BURK|nr:MULTISPECIES: hypothetical protein [Massilia]MCE3607692.1 hypothetical protein [Massilia antarctica]MCY0912036.1 hypothetical protein [Massilia sp. H27-R4]QPI51580.1 hypothetical protein IV454_08795 [Massilia antarctica]
MPELKKKPAPVVGTGRPRPSKANAPPAVVEELTVEQTTLYGALTSTNGFSVADARRQFLGEPSAPKSKRTRS